MMGTYEYFCDNPSCELHVTAADQGEHGFAGEWAELSDGRWVSRTRAGELMLCDTCARKALTEGLPMELARH
jgi:hypothetical protein